MIDVTTERISDYPIRAATSALPTTALASTTAQDARRVRDELDLMARFLRSDLPVAAATIVAFAVVMAALPVVVALDSQLVTVLLALVIGGWLWFMFRVAL
jgi:hypothetical protein